MAASTLGSPDRTEGAPPSCGTESGATLDEQVGFIFSLRAGGVTNVEDLGRGQASTK
jgi:hypothetical protein